MYLRAPLMNQVLYECDDYAHRCHSVNISEGGVLLENLPIVPEIKAIPLVVPLPQYPEFSSLTPDKLINLEVHQLPIDVLRVRARMVRSMEGRSAVDKVFVTKIGCEFVMLPENVQQSISEYVRTYAKNIIYLLNLFERGAKVEQIKNCARLLGYVRDEKISLLRMQVLHDYQSLDSL